ncbi:MAG: RNA polymerase factor sigma-54 [Gemmatimonadetes bacterium]|nr:RNA polymerase factor sigma-54 [Gemmatimonadota bacterium]MYB99960.1 RNA polymerase factor sigma-54 [Gemmatimonadota bacterium]
MSRMKSGMLGTGTIQQAIKANPRLYQAMDLLYMPLPELLTRLQQELSENPFLELSEPDSEEDLQVEEEGQDDPDDEVDWEEVMLDDFDAGGPRTPYEPQEYLEPVVVETRHLHDYLAEQVSLLQLDERQLQIAGEIVGNIDDDGLLSCPLEDVAAGVGAALAPVREKLYAEAREIDGADARETEFVALDRLFAPVAGEEVESVLQVVQSLDPPGVGARDLRECLMIQLSRLGREDTLAWRILDRHFDGFMNRQWTDIARETEVSRKAVQDAADEIAALDPRPGSRYTAEPEQYVIPDLVVEMIGGEYMVFANDTGLPRLRLSRSYRDVVADKEKFVGDSKEFIATKLNAAQWLVRMIEQRRRTMLEVMRFIVAAQRDFFDKGVQHLKPLTLREVAAHIEMAESTVSRVANDKYVQTPGGVYPLKFFFSGGLPTVMGGDISTRGVQARIKNLVDEEDTRRPLTDQALVNLLKSEGIKIARRTVAKYRDQLGVLPARMRKRV